MLQTALPTSANLAACQPVRSFSSWLVLSSTRPHDSQSTASMRMRRAMVSCSRHPGQVNADTARIDELGRDHTALGVEINTEAYVLSV